MERRRQTLIGEVVSDRMAKTVVVKVSRRFPHPVYKKYINKYKKYFAHTGSIVPKVGDIVKISAAKPTSKKKRWQVSEIIRESARIGF